MTDLLIALPLLIPLTIFVLQILLRERPQLVDLISLLGSGALLLTCILLASRVFSDGAQFMQLGAWKAPFGITFVADPLSVTMLTVSNLIVFVIAIYRLGDSPDERRSPYAPALTQGLIFGVNGAFLTGDLFNLFVWFEVMLMASFALCALGSKRSQREAALKYLVLNFLSSAFFLIGVGLLYAQIGTLNMADLVEKIRQLPASNSLLPPAFFLFVAFSIKTALFPLFSWLPASYPTLPDALGALFGGLLTKVGVYVFYRVFGMIIPLHELALDDLLLWISVATMVIGVLGAAAHYEMRKILSVHIVSQVGYMTLALAWGTPTALTAGILYTLHNMIVKTNLFLVCGTVRQTKGTAELKLLGGIYAQLPFISVLFALSAFSLAGLPPLSGFFAKFTLIRAGLSIEAYLTTTAAMLVGVLTLFSMTKIWAEVFWKNPTTQGPSTEKKQTPIFHRLAISLLTLAMLSFTLLPHSIWNMCERAAESLIHPRSYSKPILTSHDRL
ncbi:MAG: hypothetical protein NZM04_07775 [Methylacidiphilales bacterium]|nr:hypothetical protein [Candidatus Methylacidiphilales bacterium]MDW8349580.1 proton-conducting transporter membrane subunit [Verrucomicrobiae bacterium]